MAGLDNLINNNHDYAITAMAVPAASLASLAPGYAHARFTAAHRLCISPLCRARTL